MTTHAIRRADPRREPSGSRQKRAAGALIALVAAIHAGPAAPELGAQDPGLDARLASVSRRIEFFSPGSGPPGTTVTLRTGNLPAVTPTRIGIGATRFGFEEVAQVMTNERGEISLTVEIPTWAQHDLTHVFIVFDFYFNPIALSDVFHVTGPDGTVLRRGQLSEGASCPTLTGTDGVAYALSGNLAGFAPGDHVSVEGRIGDETACGESGGTTIAVARILPGAENP